MKQSPPPEYLDELLTGHQPGAAFDGSLLADPFFAEALFDLLSDVVFFVKDAGGCYVVVNTTLTQRCGFQHKSRLIGRSPIDVFPPELGASYAAQDRQVIATGEAIEGWLELHLYPNRAPGWCLTHKLPLFDRQGRVIGLTGISRDLRMPDKEHPVYRRIATTVTYIQEHYAEPLRIEELARIANISVAQFERYIQRIFDLTPKQLLTKTRLDAAAHLLVGDRSVAEIAQECGYADHSAFSRQFRAVVGLSPTAYRTLRHKQAGLSRQQDHHAPGLHAYALRHPASNNDVRCRSSCLSTRSPACSRPSGWRRRWSAGVC